MGNRTLKITRAEHTSGDEMTATPKARRSLLSRWRPVVVGIALVGVLVGTGGGFGTPPAAQALKLDLPTWQDVQNAKKKQSTASAKVTEIEGLIKQVEDLVEETKKKSEEAAEALEIAEQELMEAQQRTEALEEQAAQSEEEAADAAEQAASLVSQMYRSGGVDRNVELFLESDDQAADSLLERLAQMSKATERNTKVSEEAEQAMNTAESLGKQAATARDERDRLRDEAEEKREEAAAAAAEAVDELAEQEEQKKVLETQLAALKDKTTKTVDGYQERLRLEEQERQRLAEEAAKRAREAARAGGGGGGGGSGGGGGGGGGGSSPPPSSSGWVRPTTNYYISDWWGNVGWRTHGGVDFAAPSGTPIYSVGPGTVSMSGWFGNYGYMTEVTHSNGLRTRYGHQVQPPPVRVGQRVGAGSVIGYVGSTGNSTGPHLHFETWVNGANVNPVPVMRARGVTF